MKILWINVFVVVLFVGSSCGASVGRKRSGARKRQTTTGDVKVNPNLPDLEGPVKDLLVNANLPDDIQKEVEQTFAVLLPRNGNPLDGVSFEDFAKMFTAKLKQRQGKGGSTNSTERLRQQATVVSDFIKGHTGIINEIMTDTVKSAQRSFQALFGNFAKIFGRGLLPINPNNTMLVQEDAKSLLKSVISTLVDDPFSVATKFVSRFQKDLMLAKMNTTVLTLPRLPDPEDVLDGVLDVVAGGF